MDNQENDEKVIELANYIRITMAGMQLIDWDFARECTKGLKKFADRYDSTAALNRGWNPHKSAEAKNEVRILEKLIELNDLIMQGYENSQKAEAHEMAARKIGWMFGT